MNKKTIFIGTRASALALWQANWVKDNLSSAYPEYNFELVKIKTKGDKILDVALAKVGDKGLFVKEIEEALIRNEVDLAVHSMKDVPTVIPDELKLGAICEREDPRDVFISRDKTKFEDLPKGSVVGTSSLRRIAQLSNYKDGIIFKDLRGNLNTRFTKLESGEYSGMILACAGVKRLGMQDKITQHLPFEVSLPAVGQGAVGIEIRKNDELIESMVTKILLHKPTYYAILAERALMRRLEGGCQIPIAALATVTDKKIYLKALVASLDGKKIIKDEMEGTIDDPESLGVKLAEKLVSKGADEILLEVRNLGCE